MAPKKSNQNSGLVYSTKFGRMCPGCSRPVSECACGKNRTAPKADGIIRLMRETKGRKGKGVTVITGVPLDDDGLKYLTKDLRACGCGGTVKDGVIDIQGDHRDTLEKELKGRGYKVKRAGG